MKPTFRHRLLPLLGPAALLVLAGADVSSAMNRLRYQEYPHLEGLPVRQVLILGNNATQELVFRREMTLTEGVPFESKVLWRDWENLVDLGLFANIEVDAVTSGDGVLVVVSAHERPRWFMAPVFDYNLRSGDIAFGYRLRFRNLSGLNQSFQSNARVGGRHNLNFTWSTPWLGRKRRTLAANLRLELPQAGVDELRTNSVTLGTTKFLGDFRRLRRGLTHFTSLEIVERDGTSPAGAVNQLIPSVGTGFFRDSRNVRVDPDRGSLFSASTQYVTGWTTSEISYLRGVGDARKFLALGKRFVLAGRAVTVLTAGDVPDYRRVGVGGAGSIRGQPGSVATGQNLARASVELRFALIGKRRFNLPIPLAPRRVRNFDLRFDGVVFADAGSAWENGPGFRDASLKEGFGVGLRIFLPVFELARLELAFDGDGEPTLYFREGNLI